MQYPKLEDLNSSTCTSRVMKVRYPEFYQYLMDNYEGLKFTEALYRFYHPDWNNKCRECGNPTKFANLTTGYREFCSHKCCNNSLEVQKRRENACIERFGCKNPMTLDQIKNKLKETNLMKYGVDNVSKAESIKEKIRQTNLENIGVEYPMMSEDVLDKSRQTCLKKYGVEYYTQSDESREYKKNIKDEVHKKMIKTRHKNMIKNNDNVLDYDGVNYTLKCPDSNCNKCSEKCFTIPATVLYARRSNNIDICTNRTTLYFSSNTSIEKFIRNILDENNIQYVTNDRTILDHKELDILIPDKNLAIECNGLYWHSLKTFDYHYKKWETCLNKNIQLLNIWEDWIVNKPEIVKSIILSKLGIYNERIGARICLIKPVSSKESNKFLDDNHIQGKCNSGVRLGLYYKNELVSLMTFGKRRSIMMGSKTKDECWELLRFCTKRNTQVIGGAERLLSYFIKTNKPKNIISFASHDISNGDLYKKLGFDFESQTISSYWYIHKKTFQRFHRFNFRKSVLVDMGYDPNLSESEIMAALDYYKIYDSGQSKFIKTIKASQS